MGSTEHAGREVRTHRSKFNIGDVAKVVDAGETKFYGGLIDLGSHSSQAEERLRGFSFVDDGPLDLRLNPGYGIPASEWLQTATVSELAWVIFEHGEDNDVVLSQRLAEAILERQRRLGPYRRKPSL